VLKAQQEASRPAPSKPPAQRLREDLLALAAIARRAVRLMRQEGQALRPEDLKDLSRCLRSAEAETHTFFSLYRKELLSAGPEYTNSHIQTA
jgi:hypothetical protein